MRCNPIAAALVIAGMALTALPAAAQPKPQSQTSALAPNPNIVIDYIDPRTAASQATLQRLRKRQVLEEMNQFLSPLRLPRVLRIRTKTCGQANAYYVPAEWAINICYEYYEYLEGLATRATTTLGFTRGEVIVGGFIDALLHELGHAVFDLYQIPVFGREEDGADQLAALLMLQFGKEVARTTIKGSAFTYLNSANPRTRTQFADEHGTAGQRFFNYVCMGYGADPATFKDFVDRKLLPPERAVHCPREYQQVAKAFLKTLMPHIDQNLMKQVQSRQWLRPDEVK
jgi:hypothetical protein